MKFSFRAKTETGQERVGVVEAMSRDSAIQILQSNGLVPFSVQEEKRESEVFRDFTRIASSDPSMWRDIALMNRLPLLSVLDRYQQEFAALKEKVAAGDGVWLENYFTTSKRLRDEII